MPDVTYSGPDLAAKLDTIIANTGGVVAANVLTGTLTHTVTTAAATVITIPAGRTWTGTVGVSCAVEKAAAAAGTGEARGTVAVAGTGVTPAAGTLFEVECLAGAGAATGTAGTGAADSLAMPATVIAPAGNAVTVTFATTIVGTSGRTHCAAIGRLL